MRSEIEYGIVAQRSPIRSTDPGPNRQPPFVLALIAGRVLDAVQGVLAVCSVPDTPGDGCQTSPAQNREGGLRPPPPELV